MKKRNLRENFDDTVEPAKEKILSYGDYFKKAKYLALSLQSLDNAILEAKLQKKQLKQISIDNYEYPTYSLATSYHTRISDTNYNNIRKEVNIHKMQLEMRLKKFKNIDSSPKSSPRRSPKSSPRRSPKH